jgi:hypothetical protein
MDHTVLTIRLFALGERAILRRWPEAELIFGASAS